MTVSQPRTAGTGNSDPPRSTPPHTGGSVDVPQGTAKKNIADPESGTASRNATSAAHIRPPTAGVMPMRYPLDARAALDPSEFPHRPKSRYARIPTTIPNVQHILTSYDIQVRYDVIAKRLIFEVPGLEISGDRSEAAVTEIISLTQLNGLQIGPIRDYIAAIGDRNHFNPAEAWIRSQPWDRVDRLPDLFNTVKLVEGYPVELRNTLLRRWLLSAVAAALMATGFRARGVLTLQGGQGIGKTSWLMSLLPADLRARLLKVDHHLDAGNKDSILGAVSHWLVEIGELDSSFKKDVARLKGFLTATHDKIRRPYGRDESEYPRRTVFAATVNEANFLVDMTGNSRWWTIEVERLNFDHGIDMQQVFAQLAEDFEAGAQWWLTEAEEAQLDQQNKAYLACSVIRDKLHQHLAAISTKDGETKREHLTATEILERIGIQGPSSAQVREAAPILREQFGRRKKVKGKEGWAFPVAAQPGYGRL